MKKFSAIALFLTVAVSVCSMWVQSRWPTTIPKSRPSAWLRSGPSHRWVAGFESGSASACFLCSRSCFGPASRLRRAPLSTRGTPKSRFFTGQLTSRSFSQACRSSPTASSGSSCFGHWLHSVSSSPSSRRCRRSNPARRFSFCSIFPKSGGFPTARSLIQISTRLLSNCSCRSPYTAP